jgi:hypothetical protein
MKSEPLFYPSNIFIMHLDFTKNNNLEHVVLT